MEHPWLIYAIFLLLIFSPPVSQAATPAGTIINNTATLNYQVDNHNVARQTSNTDRFIVIGLNTLNQGHITPNALQTNNLFAGSTLPFNIILNNEGVNSLEDGVLTVRLAAELNFELMDSNAVLQSQSTLNGITTYLYSVAPLPAGTNVTYPAQLTIPASTLGSNNELNIIYQANRVEIDHSVTPLTVKERTKGILQLLQYSADADASPLSISPTEFMQNSGLFASIPPPMVEALGVSAISTPIPVKPATNFSHKQIVFIKLEEADHNINSTLKETVEVDFNIGNNEESERLRLTETEADSGIFTGYITLNSRDVILKHNGYLSVNSNTQINVSYTDSVDNSDSSSRIILVDPFGILFDSSTGALLNGYTVAMMNTDTGLPAQVFGDDGISTYPSTVITGGSVTDSGGAVYHFAEGAYRFPFAPLGNYRLVVTPPNDVAYVWPSQQPDALINQLPNAPYAITLGSRGETFPLLAGPPLHIDIPLDRINSPLQIRRSAHTNTVSPGDFIRFTVEIENVDSVTIDNIILTDSLPRGFRLEPNSIHINDRLESPPVISKNAQELTFTLNSLNAGETIILEYVAAIGAIKQGRVHSSSAAFSGDKATQSNTATVNTQITEDFMRHRAILMGQVIIEEQNKDRTDVPQGLKGVRIYMEDGRYAITDENGMYHFDHILPGSHVVQLDLDTLPPQYETVLHNNNTRFSGRAWSQFVDIQGGTLWRSDFHVALKPKPQGNLSLQIHNSALLDHNELNYAITLNNKTVSLDNQRLTVMIPPNMRYKPNSSTFKNQSIKDPVITHNMLTFKLGSTPKNNTETLQFTVSAIETTNASEMISKAFMVFNTPDKQNQRTPIMTHTNLLATQEKIQHISEEFALDIQFDSADDQINTADKRTLRVFADQVKGLNNLRIHAVGHSDNRKLLPKTQLRFKDNYHLSANRATVIANELRDLLKLTPGHITVEGRGPEQPITNNSTPEKRRANRRVHLYVYSDQISQQGKLASIQAQHSEKMVIDTYGTHTLQTPQKKSPPPINDNNNEPKQVNPNKQSAKFNQQWLAQQAIGIEWVFPSAQDLPEIASTPIAIKHKAGQRINLSINDQPVEKFNFEGTLVHTNGVAVSTWRGVDLSKGSNHFEAIVYDNNNNEIKRIQRNIHLSNDPVTAEIVAEQSTLIADGIQKPVIAIQLLDKDGYPVRNGVRGEFRIAPPYKALRPHKFNTDVMLGSFPNQYEYQVTEDGIAFLTLEPTTESGEVQVTLPFTNSRVAELTPKLTAKTTPWILVGLAEGSAGYETLTKKSSALTEDETKNHLYQDNRIAFFAKGKIQGKWLLTIAYDSNKNRPNETDPELFQAIDPDTYYTLYGDTAHNGYAAPSSEKLYLKLEQDQFYFLFGDYQTALNETQLSKYNRTLTGIKSRYHDERYDVIVFASDTNQAFVKDEFRGKGLTGPYQLSRNNIAMNSEELIIEIRDRLRSDIIVSTTKLSRHQDYQIDYQTGTITFRTPVFSTDQQMNPQYIIVKYESFDAGDDQMTYGGRAKVAVNEQLSLGVSHINEGRTGGEATLDGVDMSYQFTDQTKLTIEAAQTADHKETASNKRGTGYVTEIEHQTEHSHSKMYFREQEAEFGLGQTNASENGLRKMGIETTLNASDHITVKGQAYQQKNTMTDLTREVLEAEGQSKISQTDLQLGLRTVNDQQDNSTNNDTDRGTTDRSQQITAGASHHFMDNKLTTSIRREQNVSSGNSIDFPNRTRLGASYRVTPKTSLFIEQDITDGTLRNTRNTLIGIKSAPWRGGEIYSGITQSSGSEENVTHGNVSARQIWQLTDQWRLDVGAEEVRLLNSDRNASVNNDTSLTSSSTDEFTAGSVGITYFPENWMWSARAETRNSPQEDIWQLATSIQTNPSSRLSTLSTLALSNSQQSNGLTKKETAIRLGLAYRPLITYHQGNWILLNKLDLKWSDLNQGTLAGNNWRIINNLNANYKRDRWQLSLQYAAKTVNETINKTEYTSFTDLIGFETRYDITPKWDVGLHGNMLRAVKLNQYDYNSGLSVGRTVSDNIWVSLGYNVSGFHDEDFSHSRYTTQGPFIRFRMKVDQQSVKELVNWAGL